MKSNHCRRRSALAHPSLSRSWTLADQDRACREGWAIFEASRDGITVLEIERNDINDPPFENAPRFKFDEDAKAHVYKRAREGSRLHRRALRIHQEGRRTWRIEDQQEGESGERLVNPWVEELLLLLARERCSAQDRARCVQGLSSLNEVLRKHAKSRTEREACAALEDYIRYELARG